MKNVLLNLCRSVCIKSPQTFRITMMIGIFCLAAFAQVNAQQITVRGKVSDDKGVTLPGVTVKLKGVTAGTSTDVQGSYSISVPRNGTLVFSFLGYVTKEVAVNNQNLIDVALAPSTTELSEVVVTALGIERQAKSLAYTTQTVSIKELTQARELSVVNALQGKVAGLSISSSSTGLDASSLVVLRGTRSITGGNGVLYVIDGVAISGSPTDINSDNIASINILKGPNAAALYGSQGQNGAIVIETNKGRAGQVHISLNNNVTIQDPKFYVPFQYVYGQGSGGNYIASSEDAWGPKMQGQMVNTWSINPLKAGTQYAFSPQPNNKTDVFQTGYNAATSLVASIGGEKTQTVFAYTYTNAEGIVPLNKLQRHNLSLRVTSNLSNRLTLDTKIDYEHHMLNNQEQVGESSFNPMRGVYGLLPNIRTQDVADYQFLDAAGVPKQEYWYPGTTTGDNPYWSINNYQTQDPATRVISFLSLSYKFTDAIKLMVRGTYDGTNSNSTAKTFYGTYRAPTGSFAVSSGSSALINGDFLVSYKKDIIKDLNLDVNAGGSIRDGQSSSVSASQSSMTVPNFWSISNGPNTPSASYSAGSHTQTQSLYAVTSIAWRDAVFLDLTGRNDWSSTLPAAHRSYFYPSAALGVVVSDLVKLPKVFSFAKLRATMAQVGNSPGAYQLQRTASLGLGGNLGYLTLSTSVPSADLHSEKTISTELGLDVRFFSSRLGLDVTAYKTNTKDQLFTVSLPVGTGSSSSLINGGNVENKGLEVILTSTPVKSQNLKWDFNVNFALNRNKVLSISPILPKLVVGSDSYFRNLVAEEGFSYGRLYSKGWLRNAQGQAIVGATGLPQVTPGMTVAIGDVNPQWTGGVSNSLTFKNINFAFTIAHTQGGIIASNTGADLAGQGLTENTLAGREGGLIFGKNIFTNVTAVKADGTPNDIPITAQQLWQQIGGRTAPVGEAFVSPQTNTRLREAIIGYTLPKAIVSKLTKVHVSNVQLSLVGRNLFFIYRADKSLDPDFLEGTGNGNAGFSSFAPPTSRSYGLNLKVDF